MKTSVIFDMLNSGWAPCFNISEEVVLHKNIGWVVVHSLFPMKK